MIRAGLLLLLIETLYTLVAAFSMSNSDNLAVYWGQDSADHQQRLSFYCQDDTIDVIPLAFLYVFFGESGKPEVDFSNICNSRGQVFADSALADCSFLASDIKTCQSKGKIVTISLGGATGQVGFPDAGTANDFAETIWDMFLGGESDTRPFGDAVLDGVDLDIESGSSQYYSTFVKSLRTLSKNSDKQYYITAAPQCPFPDAALGSVLNDVGVDAVFVQFYNNDCELSQSSGFNFETWDQWAKTTSPNPNVKIYIGAPASPQAADSGYVDGDSLAKIMKTTQSLYPSFGGAMLWDADSAHNNNKFDVQVKKALRQGEGGAAAQQTTLPTSRSMVPPSISSPSIPEAIVPPGFRDPRAWARVRRPADSNIMQPGNDRPRVSSRFFRF